MRFDKKDCELAAESADHHRSNLVLANSTAWDTPLYPLGANFCVLCDEYLNSIGCGKCPLKRLRQRCEREEEDTLYERITDFFDDNCYVIPAAKKKGVIHAFTDMVRVLDLIATGSCTIAQAKPTEMKR
jgi:hypothetical protein